MAVADDDDGAVVASCGCWVGSRVPVVSELDDACHCSNNLAMNLIRFLT